MTKRKKYQAETEVMKILEKEKFATIPLLTQRLNHKSESTVRRIIKVNLNKKIGVRETGTNRIIKKEYFLLKYENVTDDESVALIKENLQSKIPERIKTAIDDLKELCKNKKIIQQDFLEYIFDIINKPKTKYHKIYRDDLIRIFYHTLIILTKDEEDKLVGKIKNLCQEYFEKVVLNESEKINIRNVSLNILILIEDPNRIDISFKIIEKTENGNYNQLNMVESIICNYANIKPIEIRKRLYELIGPDKDEIVINRALHLLEKTRYTFTGMEHQVFY